MLTAIVGLRSFMTLFIISVPLIYGVRTNVKSASPRYSSIIMHFQQVRGNSLNPLHFKPLPHLLHVFF